MRCSAASDSTSRIGSVWISRDVAIRIGEHATIGEPGFVGGTRRAMIPSTAAGYDSYEREAWEHEVGLVGGRKSWRDSDPW